MSAVTGLSAIAYIDPGTVSNVFGGLAPYLGAVGAFFLALAWPSRLAWRRARLAYGRLSWVGRTAVWLLIASSVGSLIVGGSLLSQGHAPAVTHTEVAAAPRSAANQTTPGPTRAPQAMAMFDRVIVLGIDGLDAGLMEELIEAGQLPHFAQLKEAGGYARLTTSTPPESPVAWSSIATGVDPAAHGIYDFLHRSPQTYLPSLALRKASDGWLGTKYVRARQRDGFWVYTSTAGIPTTVIRWPVAFPAEKVTGRFLAGFGVPDLVGGEGRYSYFTSTPPAEDDLGKNNVSLVSWDGKTAQLALRGPLGARRKETILDLTARATTADTLTIAAAGGGEVVARRGAWSAWLPVEFAVGLGTKVHGQVKFYLVESAPELRLVASPIHMDPVEQAFAMTQPREFGAELRATLGPFHTLGMPEQIHPLSHGRYDYDAFLAECRAVTAERRKMLELELARFERGVLAFVFDTTDRVQHAFWATRDREHPAYNEADAVRYGDVIPAAYREMDEVLGQVLARCDERTALVVLSDHGFNSFRRAVHVNRWLIEQQLMTLRRPNNEAGAELFKDVDWGRTTAYSCGFASVYLNIVGREKHGAVQPAATHGVAEELAERLRRWIDPDTGQHVFKGVYLGEDLYPAGDRATRPDIILGFNAGYRASWQTALGAAPTTLIDDNATRWSGDHLIDASLVPGVVFCNRPLTNRQPALVDICPTVLECLGVKRPPEMRGTALIDPGRGAP